MTGTKNGKFSSVTIPKPPRSEGLPALFIKSGQRRPIIQAHVGEKKRKEKHVQRPNATLNLDPLLSDLERLLKVILVKIRRTIGVRVGEQLAMRTKRYVNEQS